MKKYQNLNGILLIDKPQNITSHDVVNFVRRRLSVKKVGHSGTLDPMATGVLVVLLGNATKLASKFTNFDKEYYSELTLGAMTDTSDAQGKIIRNFPESSYSNLKKEDFEVVLESFKGEINQVPPMFSALRFKGHRLYDLARRGIEVPREPRKIKIFELELLEFNLPKISFRVVCSKGTYIRKLSEDIGETLGCGAYQSKLRRTRVGEFKIQNTILLDDLNESHIRNN